MDITFLGGAREVTGSCYRVRVGASVVILDLGLFQGHRAESNARNIMLPFEVNEVAAVLLSHAHLDHSGRLPLLARLAYDKPIYATPATRDLCGIMLADSARVQDSDAQYLAKRKRSYVLPLYTSEDAAHVMERFVPMPVGRQFDVAPGIRATFCESGHILGSASIALDCTEGDGTRRLVYSADLGRWGLPIIRDPDPPRGRAAIVLLESTYGDRDHAPLEEMMPRLGAIIRETAARGGRVLIPAFAVGRTQEILYDLHRLARDQAIPSIPIVLDSPLGIAATTVYAANSDSFDESEQLVNAVDDLFAFRQFELARDAEESKALNTRQGPMVIIAGSGMSEDGRILHHLAHAATDPRNTILIVGYQAEHTLGRCIVQRRPTIKVFDDEIPLRAQVEVLDGYSGHAGQTELRRWLSTVAAGSRDKPRVHLVHGEPGAQHALADLLRGDGFDVNIPALRERVEF